MLGVRASDDRRALRQTAALVRNVRVDLCRKARRQGGAKKRATGERVAGRGASPENNAQWRCSTVGTRNASRCGLLAPGKP